MSKRKEKSPKQMTAEEYAEWSADKSDAEIRKFYPEMAYMLPSRPQPPAKTDSDEQLLAKLPEPPAEVCSDRQILDWLQQVGEVGGSRAIILVFSSNRFWPFSARQRGDVWSAALRLIDEATAREKAEEEARQKKIREKVAKRTSSKWWNRANV